MKPELQEYLLKVCTSSPIIKILYENQLCGPFEDFQLFESVINDAIRTLLSDGYAHLRYKLLEKISLDIACKNGITKFVKILLDQGAKTNTVNRTYNRAPIHFATEGGHVETLKALLAEPTNLNLQDTEQHQTALHIAVNRNDERCAGLLLEKGASANISNSEGLTAIYLAAMSGRRDMVELILEKHWQFLNLDNYRDQNNQTTRELINQNLPELQSIIDNLVPVHIYCDSEYYLRVNDEPNFLNMQIDENFSSIAAKLLETATQNDLREAVTRILEWLERDEREEEKLKKKVIPAAHMAVEKGRYVILRKLINVVPEIINDLIMEACLQLQKLTRCRISDWLECMMVMLNQEGVNIHDLKDSKSNTPLYYAAKSGYMEAVTLFLNKDCYIGHMNKFNIPSLAYIPKNTLKNYFDNCSQMTDERANKCTIEFNYRCLKPYNVFPTNSYDLMKKREMQLFEYLIHSKTHKELIKHPLLSSFLYLKWHKIQYFLLANFVLYMFFYFTLNSYILIMGYNNSFNKNGTQLTYNENSNSTTLNCTTNNSKSPIFQNTDHYILCPIISIWLIFLIFGEILQFVCNCRYYIKDWMNGLQIILFGLTVAFLCGLGIETGIAVTLLSTWKITIMISQYLRFSISIVLFRTVLYNFICLFSPYICLIVVFSMFFHIFYGECDLSPNPVFAYIKTVITLAGNLSVMSNNIISGSHFSMWFRLVLVIFVNFIVIILTNILSGVTLIDLVDVTSQAELIELSYRIQLIANFENFACMISKLINRYFLKNSSQVCDSFVNRIFLFHSYLKDDKITFWIHDTENFDEESNTPLHDAAEPGHGEVISLFPNQDCYISHKKFNVLPLAYIPKSTLATYFNRCVKMRAAIQNVPRMPIIVQRMSIYQMGDAFLSYNDYNDYSDYSDNSNYSDDESVSIAHEAIGHVQSHRPMPSHFLLPTKKLSITKRRVKSPRTLLTRDNNDNSDYSDNSNYSDDGSVSIAHEAIGHVQSHRPMPSHFIVPTKKLPIAKRRVQSPRTLLIPIRDDNDVSKYYKRHKSDVKYSLPNKMSSVHSAQSLKLHEIPHDQRSALWLPNFVLYTIFYLILNSYVLIMLYNSSSIKIEMQLANNITLNNTTNKLNSPTQVQNILRICIAILLLFLIFRDVFQFVHKPRIFMKNWMNGLQIMLFELTIALLCDGKIQTGIVVILLATWKFMIIISKCPRKHLFTRNVIFETVLHNLRLYLSLFSPYIFPIAFSMTFYIFYKESDDKVFAHPTYATIKTVIMLTGDFVIDKSTFDLHYMWPCLVLVIFVFLIVIVLMNNLNGLKVSDILKQIEHIKLNELIYRWQLIAYFENIICMIIGLINHYFFKNLF